MALYRHGWINNHLIMLVYRKTFISIFKLRFRSGQGPSGYRLKTGRPHFLVIINLKEMLINALPVCISIGFLDNFLDNSKSVQSIPIGCLGFKVILSIPWCQCHEFRAWHLSCLTELLTVKMNIFFSFYSLCRSKTIEPLILESWQ